jgi:hypothetical protein
MMCYKYSIGHFDFLIKIHLLRHSTLETGRWKQAKRFSGREV